MKYKVNLKALDNSFSVPNALADNFIKLANPKHIIILLWVLRYAETPKSAEEISAELKLDKAVVNEAIFYWIDNGLIIPDSTAEIIISKEPEQISFEDKPAPEKKAPKMPARKLGSSMATAEDILKRSDESPEYKYLLQKSQVIFGRTISRGEQSMLLSLMDNYGLKAEVILMLITYAVENGKSGTNYIQAVGEGWADEGIETIDDAERKIAELKEADASWSAFCSAVGKPIRKPTKKQQEKFIKWNKEWHMPIELIAEAYERMLDNIDKVNFNYLDKILEAWHNAGVRTLEGVKAFEEKPKAKAKASDDVSFSVDDYENYIKTRKLKYKKEEK